MNIYNDAGELLFGTRLKRLSERFLFNITKIYKTLDIPFEPAWFPMFFILYRYGPKSVTEIAELLDITHSAVSQQATILERKGLLHFIPSDSDRRKRLLNFTKDGLALLEQIQPVWQSIKRNMQRLLLDNPNSVNILPALTEIEETSVNKDLFARVLQDLREHHFTIMDIIPFSSEYETEYKALILDWMINNENTKFEDADFLNKPGSVKKNNSGSITLAKPEQEIAGTVVTKYLNAADAQILFLMVKKDWQQRQIGRILLMDAIKNLRNDGFTSVTAYFDRKHIAALKVLKSCGFKLFAMHHGLEKNHADKTILQFTLNLKE
ncbi:MAG: GNAT family N-acetyltransferase [Calditrichaeota bacterium]|nr:MAG: GNAT family N-acetyltransferase [Calditrichota bacterium]